MEDKMNYSELLFNSIVEGRLESAIKGVEEALDAGDDPQNIVSEYMIKAMEEIGRRFEEGRAYVPNLLMAARAMKGALEIVKPLMTGGTTTTIGKVIIGTVLGDLHDIGKNLVASMFEGCGFEVINLGTNISAEQFVQAAEENDADIVCLSALLTTTMKYMETIIHAFEKEGMRDKVIIMVGGAPVNQKFADQIGADAYTDNANAAVTVAKALMKQMKEIKNDDRKIHLQ